MALRQSAERLAGERAGASWREISSAATWQANMDDGRPMLQRGVSPKLGRQTIKNMVHAGELVEVGREKPAGSTHWHALYAPAERTQNSSVDTAGRALGELMTSWVR